jgi:ABC-type Fe3+ transport system substrate-binding protein
LGIPSRAPHPNAAKVFINWFLSREGQMALQKFGRPDAHNSRRIDISKDTSILTIGWRRSKNISIWPNPSIRI